MKIILKDSTDVNKKGIYRILNTINNKSYIGSSCKSFCSRFSKHYRMLSKNKHPAKHLQSAWNKYGADVFEFIILECNTDNKIIIQLEKKYINEFNTCDSKFGYNTNPNPELSPGLIDSVKDKISKTLKHKYSTGEISKTNEGSFKDGIIPWNKGLKSQYTINKRGNMKKVEVFNDIETFGIWNNIIELSEWSLTDANNLPIKSVYSKAWRGRPINFLQHGKIMKAIKNNTPYKGLFFKYVDFGMDVVHAPTES